MEYILSELYFDYAMKCCAKVDSWFDIQTVREWFENDDDEEVTEKVNELMDEEEEQYFYCVGEYLATQKTAIEESELVKALVENYGDDEEVWYDVLVKANDRDYFAVTREDDNYYYSNWIKS